MYFFPQFESARSNNKRFPIQNKTNYRCCCRCCCCCCRRRRRRCFRCYCCNCRCCGCGCFCVSVCVCVCLCVSVCFWVFMGGLWLVFRINTQFWWELHPRGPRLSSMAMAPEDQRMDGPTEDPPVDHPPACNCPRCRGRTVQEWSQEEWNDQNEAHQWSAQEWAEWEAYVEKWMVKKWPNLTIHSQPQSRTQDNFDMEHFLRFSIFTAHYSQHNIALKWFRESTAAIGQTSVVFFSK